MYATEIETHKAKKQHRCDWCWQFVNAGETYKRYRYYNGGDVGTVKMHPECHDVMQDEAREEGSWFEWTPGQERPAPSNRSITGGTSGSRRRTVFFVTRLGRFFHRIATIKGDTL